MQERKAGSAAWADAGWATARRIRRNRIDGRYADGARRAGYAGPAARCARRGEFFSSRFGHDFAHVRVHADAGAAESARSVHALAYTVGSDVVFGAGQYAPGTRAGKQLLAHELAHVVQQSGRSASAGGEAG